MLTITEEFPDLNDEAKVEYYDFADCYTVRNPEGDITRKDAAFAIARANGNITRAARLLSRSRRHLDNFIQRDHLLSDWVDDVEQTFIDEVESKYKETALQGDDTACRFFLNTKGKKRGYSTRIESTGEDGSPLMPPSYDPTKLSDAALQELLASRGDPD